MKSVTWLGMVVGSGIGGYIPSLFGAGIFSGWAIFGTLAGGVLGMWIGYRMES